MRTCVPWTGMVHEYQWPKNQAKWTPVTWLAGASRHLAIYSKKCMNNQQNSRGKMLPWSDVHSHGHRIPLSLPKMGKAFARRAQSSRFSLQNWWMFGWRAVRSMWCLTLFRCRATSPTMTREKDATLEGNQTNSELLLQSLNTTNWSPKKEPASLNAPSETLATCPPCCRRALCDIATCPCSSRWIWKCWWNLMTHLTF